MFMVILLLFEHLSSWSASKQWHICILHVLMFLWKWFHLPFCSQHHRANKLEELFVLHLIQVFLHFFPPSQCERWAGVMEHTSFVVCLLHPPPLFLFEIWQYFRSHFTRFQQLDNWPKLVLQLHWYFNYEVQERKVS